MVSIDRDLTAFICPNQCKKNTNIKMETTLLERIANNTETIAKIRSQNLRFTSC